MMWHDIQANHRGQLKRHLLTTGWSPTITKKSAPRQITPSYNEVQKMVHHTASKLLSGSEILENNGESTTRSKPWKESCVSRRSYEEDTTPYPLQSGQKKNPYPLQSGLVLGEGRK
ncbi:hypothetical protein C5167_018868 [Papaver somniferum]|uniref:Uncharacterized protein n=1 Tax=Papaver somniferum TaxID=3469 RepID=A0A4Y7IRW1_PAPSO|nr:hypothetical protein C5167_018868 [Papaver somniferum]